MSEETAYLAMNLTSFIVAVFFVTRRVIEVEREEARWL